MGSENPGLPEGFGALLGQNCGVPAYSNGHCRFVAGPEHTSETGLAWQCVEYARRWWRTRLGLSFAEVGTAAEMWSSNDGATNVENGRSVAVQSFENGSSVPPAPGDLIIYRADPDSEHFWAGHVAVIVQADADRLYLAEQNFTNRPWPAPMSHARVLGLENSNGGYRAIDASGTILGWQRARVPAVHRAMESS